jgi:hypothetical protein
MTAEAECAWLVYRRRVRLHACSGNTEQADAVERLVTAGRALDCGSRALK